MGNSKSKGPRPRSPHAEPPLSHEAELRKIDFLRNWSLQDNNPNFLRKSLYEAALNGRSEDVQYLADLSDNHKCTR